MKQNKTPIIKMILFPLIFLIFFGAFVFWSRSLMPINEGSTLPWKPDYASPRQYYEENGQNLKSTSRTIDGINYIFDDIGNAIQDESEGIWLDDAKYQLVSGVELKNKWYEIDERWYYFNNEGTIIKNMFAKINDKKYFFDDKGVLVREPFVFQSHQYGTTYSGEVKTKGSFWVGDDYYVVDSQGHGKLTSTATIERAPENQIKWDGIIYYQDSPTYFFKDKYILVGETKKHADIFPIQEGYSFNISLGAEIYTKNDESNVIYIYDQPDNTFYSYTPKPKSTQR